MLKPFLTKSGRKVVLFGAAKLIPGNNFDDFVLGNVFSPAREARRENLSNSVSFPLKLPKIHHNPVYSIEF